MTSRPEESTQMKRSISQADATTWPPSCSLVGLLYHGTAIHATSSCLPHAQQRYLCCAAKHSSITVHTSTESSLLLMHASIGVRHVASSFGD